MTRMELAGRVRDICAGVLLKRGEVPAAQVLFWQPAPVLLKVAEAKAKARPRRRIRASAEREVANLLSALRARAGEVRIPETWDAIGREQSRPPVKYVPIPARGPR